ncbi:MAG: ABC transporter substrate-binding protein [Bacilli bacterium]|nr:ABC transporter substrate-binding protein [Bacilli bacterium]
MKRIFIYGGIVLIALIATLIIIFLNNNNEENKLKTLKVAEVTHSPFYTPLYIAIEKGYFEEVGLNIDLILTSGANNVVAAVLSGDVEIGFCGPEATIYVYNEGKKDYVATFAGLTKRDGQFIVSRQKLEKFTMADLAGKEVIAGRAGGMPIINFMNAVKNAKIENVNINDSVDFANLTSAFISGEGDFVNLFEPNATKIENMGYGYVVASIGKHSGEVPYTAFNAKKSFIKNNASDISNFKTALNEGLKFTKNNNSETIAKIIIKQFPDASLNELIKIIDRYKKADSWLSNTTISKKMFENLENMMIDSGFIKSYVPFEDLIINE